MNDPDSGARLGGPYRVELRTSGAPVLLGTIARGFAHHAELTPYAVALHRQGLTHGAVVLVAEASAQVVARRRLERPVRPWKRPESIVGRAWRTEEPAP